MSLLKCLIYGLIIAILIIIIINLFTSIKENFDEVINESNDDKMPSPVDVNNDKPVEEIKEDDKGIINNMVDNIVDKVKETIKTDDNKMDNVEVIDEQPASTQIDDKQEDIKILPKFIDTVSSTVLDGPKMIPENAYSPWANVYMNDDGDTSFMIDLGDGKDNKDGGSGRFSERSPACCSAQYPIPFKVKVNDKILKNKDNYVPNPYMGNNNWENAGCTCMTRENAVKLSRRGGNA